MSLNANQEAARAAFRKGLVPGDDPHLDYIVTLLSGVGRRVEAIAVIEMLVAKTRLVHSALLYEQAKEQVAKGTPAQAALWFLENVADDDPNRSDLFFAIKRRLQE